MRFHGSAAELERSLGSGCAQSPDEAAKTRGAQYEATSRRKIRQWPQQLSQIVEFPSYGESLGQCDASCVEVVRAKPGARLCSANTRSRWASR